MKRFLLWAAIIAVVAIAALAIGNYSGRENAEKAKARLELVWPDFDNLPDEDRALLGGYSLACKLPSRPLEAAEVIACLRDAAAHEDSILPRGMTNEQAKARLEKLISDVRK